MMEFMFDYYDLDGSDISSEQLTALVMAGGFDTLENYLGARSTHTNANIPGMEISIVGQGDIGEISITTLAGYTYINPTAINPDLPT